MNGNFGDFSGQLSTFPMRIFLISLVFDYFPSRYSQTTKVIISGIPQHANFSDVEPLLKQYGNVEECDAVASKDPKTQTVHITFETFEQAQR